MSLLKKYIWLPTILIPMLILIGLSIAWGQEEELMIDNMESYQEKQRPAVPFPHEYHMGDLECLECHHDYEHGENILDEYELEEGNADILCNACHDAGSDIDLKKAYHRQCMGCHRQSRISGTATGPELCGECHIK